MRSILISLIIGFTAVPAANAQAQHRILQSCLGRTSIGDMQESKITVAFYPMDPFTKAITRSGVKFSDAVAIDDLTARLTSFAVINRRTSDNFNIANDPKLLIRDGSNWTSNIIVLASGLRVVFFPRFLFVYPEARSFRLEEGDLIGSLSFRLKQVDPEKPITELDQLFELCFKQKPPYETAQILLNGPLLNPGQRGMIQTKEKLNDFFFKNDIGLSSRKDEPVAHVIVLTRSVGGLVTSIIFPYKHSGDFGVDGEGFKELFPVQDDFRGPTWELLLKEYTGISLRNGDTIELTYLPLAYPFNRQ